MTQTIAYRDTFIDTTTPTHAYDLHRIRHVFVRRRSDRRWLLATLICSSPTDAIVSREDHQLRTYRLKNIRLPLNEKELQCALNSTSSPKASTPQPSLA